MICFDKPINIFKQAKSITKISSKKISKYEPLLDEIIKLRNENKENYPYII